MAVWKIVTKEGFMHLFTQISPSTFKLRNFFGLSFVNFPHII
uniref:Uncharacterized protein n=1 Tax=Rhizophora mucronata TaxID=61149 RepID=A0A2P2Q3C5_RHIMU